MRNKESKKFFAEIKLNVIALIEITLTDSHVDVETSCFSYKSRVGMETNGTH